MAENSVKEKEKEKSDFSILSDYLINHTYEYEYKPCRIDFVYDNISKYLPLPDGDYVVRVSTKDMKEFGLLQIAEVVRKL